MSGQIEAIGEMVTGGLAAHTLDHAGGKAGQELSVCQNCGTALKGAYCHDCGQSGHVHRTIGHILEEFAHGVLHVDGKLWRTIPQLIFNPGRLTREYTHGKRVRYIAPLALYLFMVFLTALVAGYAADSIEAPDIDASAVAPASQLIKAKQRLDQLPPTVTPAERAAAQEAVRTAEEALRQAQADAKSGKIKHSGPIEQIKKASREGKLEVNIGDESFRSKVRSALENIDLVIYKVQQKAYKLAFLLVPLSLPVLGLLFLWRRGVTLYDHTVFILYSLSFMLLFGCVVMTAGATAVLSAGVLITAAVIVPPIHLFAQLKGAYRLSILSTAWRTAVLSLSAVLILWLYVVLIVVMGLSE